jgi:hypothetical protein
MRSVTRCVGMRGMKSVAKRTNEKILRKLAVRMHFRGAKGALSQNDSTKKT